MKVASFNNIVIDPIENETNRLRKLYEEEKSKREHAESLLLTRTSNLESINQKLHEQYVTASMKNQEVDYLLKITNMDLNERSIQSLIHSFLEITSMLVWTEASFSFRCDLEKNEIIPISNYIFASDKLEQEQNLSSFLDEKFDLLKPYIETSESVITKGVSDEIKKVSAKYSHINHGYLFPISIDRKEKYFIWLTFTNSIEFNQRTYDLVRSGIHQLQNILQKQKTRLRIFENYKKLKEIKSQLIQSEKMASIGTISAGIAHEINNPLSFVMTNSEVLKEYLVNVFDYIKALENASLTSDELEAKKKNIDYVMEDIPMLMNESLEGINRIRTIVNGLRTFSRADDGELKEIHLKNCIDTSLKLVSNELKHKCKIHTSFAETSTTKGSDGQIIQVLTNLLVNSAQAIADFGEINIKTWEDDSFVYASIQDNGKGISNDDLRQLFTPFFTTKPTGQGTGLGLSISYGIIKKHKGDISVVSQIGVGTTFTIKLPKGESR
jgi:signal transduction histidine kinase